ncbi:hypothetical protein PLESTB_001032500 [Pleodorina starrii]|uniref:hydroxymethylbilane synthase n=1 Tax=Pleodorina starrii TaxID=330485 RepID=A0A9W6BQ45_9CHLO|nr:hypothetical protein PLESTM_001825500 [Pleodorina starrii]GLC55820.1 hypothetical protein PLESTB_001032500 [Pleodorina starrii]GLC63806.1 hypothetical protein PLESTF_000085100 [Pleodorina starrii]
MVQFQKIAARECRLRTYCAALQCRVSRLSCSASSNEPAPGRRPLVIATRPSRLAQEQTRQVQQLLHAAAQLRDETLQLSTRELTSAGDASPSAPLRSLGSGAFTEALDAAVLGGSADMAVHSLKDCPASLREGLVLAACLPRADPRDVLIAGSGAKSLGELVPGSRVGTSSSRRAAQIRHSFPHLQVVQLRGNVEARLERIKAREISATVLALAGLQRLGCEELVSSVLSTDEMLPAACQGAVGVVCREDDPWVRQLLSAISHRPSFLEVSAERACLAALLGSEEAGRGGQPFPDLAWGCNSRHDPEEGLMDIDCFVSDLEGKDLFRYSEFLRPVSFPEDAEALGALWGNVLRMAAAGQGWVEV